MLVEWRWMPEAERREEGREELAGKKWGREGVRRGKSAFSAQFSAGMGSFVANYFYLLRTAGTGSKSRLKSVLPKRIGTRKHFLGQSRLDQFETQRAIERTQGRRFVEKQSNLSNQNVRNINLIYIDRINQEIKNELNKNQYIRQRRQMSCWARCGARETEKPLIS